MTGALILIVLYIILVLCIILFPNNKRHKHQSYNDLLNTDEWRNKRAEILDRDNHKCRYCGKTDGILQVHHKYYNIYPDGTRPNPWEYPNDALVTLCKECHERVHNTYEIRTYYRKKPYANTLKFFRTYYRKKPYANTLKFFKKLLY